MYNEILPAIVAFQKECGFSQKDLFECYPKCYVAYYENDSRESLIILEDLRAAGYEMWKKNTPVTFESVCLLMEQIGRLHGLSFVIRDQKPDLFQQLQDLPSMIHEFLTSRGMSFIMDSTFLQTISIMENSKDMDSIKRLAKDWRQILLEGIDSELLGKYGVLCHGDSWLNNMMFSMENVSFKQTCI